MRKSSVQSAERSQCDCKLDVSLAGSRSSDIPHCVTRHRSRHWVAGRDRDSPFRADGNMHPAALDHGELGSPSHTLSRFAVPLLPGPLR